jgi:hypothetical protein
MELFSRIIKVLSEIAHLERKGTPIGVNDLHIAGHARGEGLTLVTTDLAISVQNRLNKWTGLTGLTGLCNSVNSVTGVCS